MVKNKRLRHYLKSRYLKIPFLLVLLTSGIIFPMMLNAQMNISVRGRGIDISNVDSSSKKQMYPIATRSEFEDRYFIPGKYHYFEEPPSAIANKDYATTPIATGYLDKDDSRKDYSLNSFSADRSGYVMIAVASETLQDKGWSRVAVSFSSTRTTYYLYRYKYSSIGTWVNIPKSDSSTPTLLFAEKGFLKFDNPLPLSELSDGVLITKNTGTYNTGPYMVDPDLIILPNGDYVAGAHEELSDKLAYGPDSEAARHWLSKDKGKTWSKLTKTKLGLLHASTFYHKGALYALGDMSGGYGGIVKSSDGGQTWSEPVQLLEGFRNSPSHVLVSKGRIWIAYELLPRPHTLNFLSASVDSNVMDPNSWVTTVRKDNYGTGNETDMVVGRDGWPIAMAKGEGPKVHARSATESLSAGKSSDAFSLTGSGSKYSAIYDSISDKYWTLTSYSSMEGNIRTGVVLSSSYDLKTFTIERQVIQGKSSNFHGFNYPFMQIDGDDIVFVLRTAWENEMGQAQRWHDANMLTFHRIRNFRSDAGLKKASK